ncbi:MAG: ABC transporter ATP-binding protein [bacterium]
MNKLRLVFAFWRRHRGWAALLLAGTAVGTALSLTFPFLLRYIVDGIREGVARETLFRYVLLLVGFGFLRAVAEVVLPYGRARTNMLFEWLTRNRVFRHLLETGHSFGGRFPTGDTMQRLDHDLQELSWFVCSGLFRFASAALTLAFVLAVMASMSPLLTLLTVLPVGAGVWVWTRLGPVVYARHLKWRERIAETNNRIEAAFSGLRLVKGYCMEERLGRSFRASLDGRIRAAIDTVRVDARIEVFYSAISGVGILLVLWAGGALVLGDRLTLGQFVAFHAYVLMLVGPMFDIGNLFVAGRRAQGTAGRVSELEEHPAEIVPPAEPKPPQPGLLEFEDVDFAYGGQPVLKGVSLRFPAGARIGIAGTTGSGKSTIFRLLFRLADPARGRVLLSGTDIRELDLAAYRALFGYAPQEPMLFSDSIRGNIAFGREVAPAELARVVATARFDRDLAGIEQGLEEQLGERGTRLSGGQRGRVAIARALVGRPRVLVFDDATSALDAETEQELVGQLAGELAGATVVIVSHRLSILSACDYVYVLDAGRLVEEGSHTELLARRGLYRRLYERQLIEEELKNQ